MWRRKWKPIDHAKMIALLMKHTEFSRLSVYNAEVSRGLVHTPEWKAQMEELQRRYNEGHYEDYLKGNY